MPREKLATRMFPRAKPVHWVQPRDSRLLATSDSRREKENWTEVDSQTSRDCEARRHRVSVSSALMRGVSTSELANLGEDVTKKKTVVCRPNRRTSSNQMTEVGA